MNKSGIFIIDKPIGLSTNKAIQIIKKQLGVKKIGHAGTLDPLASGVVVCLINNATKLSDYFLNEDKIYEFEITLFKTTRSYDAEGEIIEEQKPFRISRSQVEDVVNYFNGLSYEQIPPIYSAIKVKGKKLYEYALNNQNIEIKSRNVTIKKLELIKYDISNHKITLKANCSKGTYIRSLGVDFAKKLNTICYITQLRRLKSGCFKIEDSFKIEDIKLESLIKTFNAIKMSELPIVILENFEDAKQGKILTIDSDENLLFVADCYDNVYASYELVKDKVYKCKRGGLDD